MKLKFFSLATIALAFTATFSSCDSNDLRLCFEADSQNVKVSQRVKFNASCSENVELYHWNFGDGRDTVTRVNTVEHTFEDEGNYYVTLHNTQQAIADECAPGGNGAVASRNIEVTK
jgi:PKD repeat protein